MADKTDTQYIQPTAAEDAGRIDPSRVGRLIAILVALVLYTEVAPMQLGMVSIVVPKLAGSFPGAGAGVTWAVTIVGIAGGASMALIGKLGDLIGKKRVVLLSGLLFLIGALLCALTHSWALFLIGRVLGGASWAMTAVEYGLVRDLMPRKWIPVAVGVIGTGFGIGGVLTPIICGALTDHYTWRSVFWFLIIYVAATTPLVMIAVPESPFRVKQKLDILGAVLFGASIGLILLYVSEGSTWGWGEITSLAYLVVGVILFLAFIAWETRAPEPMIELHLLRSRAVAIPMAVAFLVTLAISAVSIMIAYMFQTPKGPDLENQIIAGAAAQYHAPAAIVAKAMSFKGDISYANGFSTLQMALHITVWTAAFGMIFGVLGGWLCRIVGARILLITSGITLLAACALWIPWHKTWQEQVFIGLLYGISFGFYYAANPNLLIDAVPADRQGVSAGMLAVFGSIGTSVGTAVFTAIASAHPFQIVANQMGKIVVSDVPSVYTDTGYKWSYVAVGVVPAALTLLLALALRTGRTPSRGGAAAESEAAVLTEAGGAGTAGVF
ncbi:MFS transporter [Nocardia sp. alder85J]|uniref:MFS transporter n=1 Tax=Nocardia sp. alder85J TaxID=2862949 RepID=UPI001CD1E07F|nr:MFS transporter [Nocardia sp. alder85J]MCX4092396.1 MFS transporter [Nocardia sp. alder85J]